MYIFAQMLKSQVVFSLEDLGLKVDLIAQLGLLIRLVEEVLDDGYI